MYVKLFVLWTHSDLIIMLKHNNRCVWFRVVTRTSNFVTEVITKISHLPKMFIVGNYRVSLEVVAFLCDIVQFLACVFIFCIFFKGWILLMTTKFWRSIGSSKLIRHPRWDFFAPVNSTGRAVPPPPSTGRLQFLCHCFFQAMRGSTQQLSNRLVKPAHADTLAPRPQAG